MLWVGQAAFPVNHESIPLLLSFGGPILLCRPNYNEGWKSRPFAPHIPLPPCLQIILRTVLVAIFCFNIFNTSKITQKKQKGKLLVHVPITHTWDALKSLLESMNSNLEIKSQCISSVSVRVCNRVCIINTTQTKKTFSNLEFAPSLVCLII